MAFNDNALETSNQIDDSGIISRRYRSRIEKAACVIQLDLARGWKVSEGEIDLGRDGGYGHGCVKGVLPEITHKAAIRTLAVGEKDRGGRQDITIRT